jgi:hypothetical protein
MTKAPVETPGLFLFPIGLNGDAQSAHPAEVVMDVDGSSVLPDEIAQVLGLGDIAALAEEFFSKSLHRGDHHSRNPGKEAAPIHAAALARKALTIAARASRSSLAIRLAMRPKYSGLRVTRIPPRIL